MTQEARVIDGYIQQPDGSWILTQEAKDQATALYYSGRVAYDEQDPRFPIGRYNSVGEVIRFKLFQ